MHNNPYAGPDGGPLPGQLHEFWEEERKRFQSHLRTLSPEEREKVIESKLRIAHRMQSEATDTPDFKTWKNQK